jgi:hypothetical protein
VALQTVSNLLNTLVLQGALAGSKCRLHFFDLGDHAFIAWCDLHFLWMVTGTMVVGLTAKQCLLTC